MDFFLVLDLAPVDRIGEQAVQVALGEPLPASKVTFACLPTLGQPTKLLQLLDHRDHSLVLKVQLKNGPHPDRLFLIDHQLGILDVIAQEWMASDPFALPARGGDLVARPLGDNLSFELCERK